MEKLFDVEEESRRELATTDHQITRMAETLYPLVVDLLRKNGVDTSAIDVEAAKIDHAKRDDARARIKSERAKAKKK